VQLLLVILHREELLDEVLSILTEMELPDAVVVESRSGLELLERDLPIFAGLRSLVPSGIDFSSLVLCVIRDDGLAAEVLATIGAIIGGGRDESKTNTAALLPVTGTVNF
jgi:nitrogen regulatory protein P-II 1